MIQSQIAAETHWSHFVPVLAVVFTVASFWWIYVRRGDIRTFAPDAYGAAIQATMLRIRFPLVLHNSGAASITVQGLRILVDDEVLEWVTVRSTLRPGEHDLIDYASPFTIPGRAAHQVFAEFGQDGHTWDPGASGPYRMRLEWKDRGNWSELLTFDWWPPLANRKAYIAHRNEPPEPANQEQP